MWKMPFICFNALQFIFQSFCLSVDLLHFPGAIPFFKSNENERRRKQTPPEELTKTRMTAICLMFLYHFIRKTSVRAIELSFFLVALGECMRPCIYKF